MLEDHDGLNPMQGLFALAGLCEQRGKVFDRLAELRGKDLACYCPLDEPCHADVLLELAND